MNTREVREAVQKVRWDPTINFGHVLSAGSFIAVGVALYVGIAVSIQDHGRRLVDLEKQDYPSLVLGGTRRDLQIEEIQRAKDEQSRVNREMVEKLTSLDRNVAVLIDRLNRDADAATNR